MEKKNLDLIKKSAIILFIIGICVVYLLYGSHGEGDPYLVFFEVPVNDTINSSVIHLEEKDFINVQGLDVRQENRKIIRIYFRNSDPIPKIVEFKQKVESPPYNLTLRKYLEYKGVYYYAVWNIP